MPSCRWNHTHTITPPHTQNNQMCDLHEALKAYYSRLSGCLGICKRSRNVLRVLPMPYSSITSPNRAMSLRSSLRHARVLGNPGNRSLILLIIMPCVGRGCSDRIRDTLKSVSLHGRRPVSRYHSESRQIKNEYCVQDEGSWYASECIRSRFTPQEPTLVVGVASLAQVIENQSSDACRA